MSNQYPEFNPHQQQQQPYAGPQPGPAQQWQAGPPQQQPPQKNRTGLKVVGAVVAGLILIGVGGVLFSEESAPPPPSVQQPVEQRQPVETEPTSSYTPEEVYQALDAATTGDCNFVDSGSYWYSDKCQAAVLQTYGLSKAEVLNSARQTSDFVGAEYVWGGEWIVICLVPGDSLYVLGVLGEGEVGTL